MKEKDLSNNDCVLRFRRICQDLLQDGISVRLNKNRQTLISIRYQKDGSLRLSMHHQLLDHSDVIVEIIDFARRGGRGRFPLLDAAMNTVYHNNIAKDAFNTNNTNNTNNDNNAHKINDTLEGDIHIRDHNSLLNQPPYFGNNIGNNFDFEHCYRDIHQRYFPELTLPVFGWARQSPQRALRSIRFGAYHGRQSASIFRPRTHQRREPKILLNPRLRYPWIATCFIEHVFHHELCHHKQAAAPIRREHSHSPRFCNWEASYQHFAHAKQWERLHLSRLLADPKGERVNK